MTCRDDKINYELPDLLGSTIRKKGIVLSRGVHWAVILLYHENIQFIYLINMSFTISKKSFYVEEF